MSLLSTLKRFGITTGAVASASAKASVIYLTSGEKPKSVTIPTPIGLRLEIFVEKYFTRGNEYCASVRKFSGDNPDVLDGVEIIACASKINQGIEIVGGKGIGIVTKPGLKVEIGSKAISPVAEKMIIEAIKEVANEGVKVVIEVPDGEKLAEKTMNKDVGIINGISILGTTGIEYPVSDDDYLEHIKTEMCVIKTLGNSRIVLAPGNTSFEFARKMYGDIVVKIGDRVGDAVKMSFDLGFSHVILVSLPGKIVKVSAGLLNTHSKYGDARIETLTHAGVLAGLDREKLVKIANSLTVSEAMTYLTKEERKKVFSIIAERVISRLSRFGKVGVIILSDQGEILAKAGET